MLALQKGAVAEGRGNEKGPAALEVVTQQFEPLFDGFVRSLLPENTQIEVFDPQAPLG